MTNLDSVLKSRDIILPPKVRIVKAMVFLVVRYRCELDHKEGWVLKSWGFWIVVLEKTLESPLDCKEIISVNPKGNQPWIFIGRTDAEAESPILWLPEAKSRLIGKERPWCWERLRAKGEGNSRGRDGHELSKLWGTMEDRGTWYAAVHGIAKSHTQLHDWTMANSYIMGNLASIKN